HLLGAVRQRGLVISPSEQSPSPAQDRGLSSNMWVALNVPSSGVEGGAAGATRSLVPGKRGWLPMFPPLLKVSPCPTECRDLACRVRRVYHMIDTTKSRRLVMAVARVFRTGRSQAIRLPKEFRVEADTVYLKRTGEGFLVITREPWE